MIVSFAWTTEAFICRQKCKTRRKWTDEYAAKFKPGSVHTAANRDLRYGGERIGLFRVLKAPYRQRTSEMTEQDFIDEGFAFLEEAGWEMRGMRPRDYFESWRRANENPYVLEFEILELTADAEHQARNLL